MELELVQNNRKRERIRQRHCSPDGSGRWRGNVKERVVFIVPQRAAKEGRDHVGLTNQSI